MPDGRVLRIDAERKSVYIVRRGRIYIAPINEVESSARVPSARVRFGLRRNDGVETAEAVTLRRGTRTNRRQRRFGDLTGAARPGAKTPTFAHAEFGIDVRTQPVRVVEAWLEAMSEQHYDAATSLYLPEAIITTAEATVGGRKHIRRHLERLAWTADPNDVVLRCTDRFVSLESPGSGPLETSFMVRDGHIVEHWSGVAPVEESTADVSTATIEVFDRSGVPERDVKYAEERLGQLIEGSPGTIESARVKLAIAPNPTVRFPASAEATLALEGEFVRVKSAANSMGIAVDQVITKAAAKIDRLRSRRRDEHRLTPTGSGHWRHSDPPTSLSPYFERSPESREIVRHKTFAPGEMTIEEAAWDADLMDLEFFLFVDLSTGRDCLLERSGDAYLIHGLGSAADLSGHEHGNFVVVDDGPPRHTLRTALEILGQEGKSFRFFVNEATGRGNVLYRRLDGHYGLITPAVE